MDTVKIFSSAFYRKVFPHGTRPVAATPAFTDRPTLRRDDYNNLIAKNVMRRGKVQERWEYGVRCQGPLAEELLSFVRSALRLTDAPSPVSGRGNINACVSTRKWNSKTRKIKSGDFLRFGFPSLPSRFLRIRYPTYVIRFFTPQPLSPTTIMPHTYQRSNFRAVSHWKMFSSDPCSPKPHRTARLENQSRFSVVWFSAFFETIYDGDFRVGELHRRKPRPFDCSVPLVVRKRSKNPKPRVLHLDYL